MNLSIKIFIALILSVVVGLIAGEPGLPFINWWIAPIGTIFINLIKMMIVPVVFFSLVVGMTSLGDTKKLGRIGLKTILLYLCTTAVAIVIGFGIAGLVHPGVGLQMASEAAVKVKEAPSIMQVFVAMVPANPIEAMAKAQILPVIIFSLFVGVGILKVGGERAELLVRFFDAGAEVSYKIIGLVMSFAPYGVFALLLPVVAKNGPKVLLPLMSVIACVAVGCAIHAIAVYSTLAKVWGGHTPLEFFKGMSEQMLIAFTTCSSAASLTAGQMMMIVLTGTLASIGTAGVPGAGLIMLAMVLQSVGLPIEGMALVAGIDRVLDMFRTCLNITGDGAVTIVMDQEEKKHAAA